LRKGKSELGLSSTTDKQKEAVWSVEFKALGEQLVLRNIKQGAIQNEVKRQASRWLSEQARLRDRREARFELAWLALFITMAAVLIGTIVSLMALH
jgi:GH24 family phage-related lysozyme (muramidase)